MTDPYKFPRIERIHQFKKDDDFKKKKEDRDFIGSMQREVIEEIKALRCANKCKDKNGEVLGKFLIDDEHSPMTGYCGHLFCFNCAETLYGKPPTRLSPKRIDHGLFEVDCTNAPSSFLYHCKSCPDEAREDRVTHDEEEEGKHILRVFSENIMLRNLYAALKGKPGFRCEECKSGESYHPKYNTLYCVTCNSIDDRSPYFCVWHVADHLTKHDWHTLRVIERNYRDGEKPGERQVLCSLDRRDREVFAALYHCACCSTTLLNDTYKSNPHRHLACGHFIGARCVKNARKKLNDRMNKGLNRDKKRRDEAAVKGTEGGERQDLEGSNTQPEKGVYCNFCKKDPVTKCDLNVYPVLPPMNEILEKKIVFRYGLSECNCDCRLCKYTPCKTQFAYKLDHERRSRCKWCQVEHKLKQKRTGCKEKNNL